MKKQILSLLISLGAAGSLQATLGADWKPHDTSAYLATAAGLNGHKSLEWINSTSVGQEYLKTFGYEWGQADVNKPGVREEKDRLKWMKDPLFAEGYKRGQEDARKARK